jgi:hypothetical protein
MGMKKISAESEKSIVRVLRQWPKEKRPTWEGLRDALVAEGMPRQDVWSRQALSENEAIYAAYLIAKRGPDSAAPLSAATGDIEASAKIAELEAALREADLKYNRLLVRHTELVYNASLLPGGSQLFDPLPDNTKSQTG